jgi:chemotaxis protein CheC
MANNIQISELQSDAITELLNIGMGHAASSLSNMVGSEVKLSIPSIELLSRVEAARRISIDPHRRVAAIRQRFYGPFWGDALLLLPQDKSLELVRILVKEEAPLEMLMALEQDALTEIGNVILNCCLGSFGNILAHEITSELPVFLTGSAIEILLGDNKSHSSEDIVMFLRMDFILQSKDIEGYVAFILEIASIDKFKAKVDEYFRLG